MDKSKYFSIEELAKRWNTKEIDVREIAKQNKFSYRTNNPLIDSLRDRGLTLFKKAPSPDDQMAYISKVSVVEYERKHPFVIDGIPTPIGHAPPYLNEDHPYYSKELAIAVTTWLTFYEDGILNKKRGHTQQIREYLKEHHGSLLGGNAIERITTVVNVNRKK